MLKLRDVAPEDVTVKREHIVPEHELVLAGVPFERVQRLRECRSRAGFVHLGPEQSDECVPAHSFLAGGGERREQDEPPPLGGGAGQRTLVTLEPQASERL